MSDIMHLVKFQSLYLAPFLNSVIVYFVFVHDPHGELWTTILKCTPIVFLMIYVMLRGQVFTKSFQVSQRILIGLLFSCGGDALLNIDLFPHGMASFACAQLCYISAFGWRPLKWPIGLAMYLAGAGLVALVFKKLDEILVIGLPIYALLLLTMCWRAIARAIDQKNFLFILCAVGSIFFVLSDGLICVDMFLTKVPHARVWIMSTYYFAQFAISVSVTKELGTAKPKLKD